MAVNRQEWTYAINADTSKAKKQIADLFKSLDKVQKYSLDNFNIAPDLVKASHAAEELAGHLRMATNVNTGQLDLAKFNQSIRNSNTSLTELISNLGQGGSAGQAAFEQMTAAIARTQVPLRQTSALLKDMATTLKNTIKWELSSIAVHGLESALVGAVSYAKNLNTSLTNIRIVTGQSVEDMARFTKEANAAAKALSTTTKSYADASLIYYQQGDSQELAAKKAAITIKAANASFETSAKEMSEYLTAVWNSYQVGADELERYVDIMANLGAKTATSLEEIATSMQKVAATSNTVGVSMEQVSSIIATVSSVTRESAESIGTSYKTIFARIGDLKLGKADEDGIGLGQVSSQLDAIGVKILDESGNLREMGDIIMDLGTKWQTMNQAQKTAVAQVVAGKRQYTQLMALFENWDMFKANLNLAENSEGALQDMADIYAESWEAASARVQASMEGIFNSLINDQGLIKLTNFIADFVDGVGGAIDSIGGLNGVLRLTGSILMKTFSKEAGARIKEIGRSFNNIFVDPKKSHQDAANQIKKQLEDVNDKAQIDAQIQLLIVKNNLLEVEEYLSDSQKQTAQAAIAGIESQVNKVKELEDAYNDLKKAVANSSNFRDINQFSLSNGQTIAQMIASSTTIFDEKLFKSVGLSNKDKTLTNLYDATFNATRIRQQGTHSLEAISDGRLSQYDDKGKMAKLKEEAQALKQIMDELHLSIEGIDPKRIETLLGQDTWDESEIEEVRHAFELLEKSGQDSLGSLQLKLAAIIAELRGLGVSDEIIDQLRASFERLEEAGEGAANAMRGVATETSKLNRQVKQTQTNLDRTKMTFEKTVEGILDLGSGALDIVNGFSAMSDATVQWGDDTIGLTDKLGSLLSTLLSLGMAIPSLTKGLGSIFGLASGPAGWIAAGIAGIAAIGGIAAGKNQIDKNEYQEKETKRSEKREKQDEEHEENLSNIQSLIKNYNSLRETFDATGQGQDALAASARALADAYGLVGANLLIAEGNFEGFEKKLAEHAGLDKVADFYKDAYDKQYEEINSKDKNSKYYFKGASLYNKVAETWDRSYELQRERTGYGIGSFEVPEDFDPYAWMHWKGASKNENGQYAFDLTKIVNVDKQVSPIIKALNKGYQDLFQISSDFADGNHIFNLDDIKIVKETLDEMYADEDNDYTAQNIAFTGLLSRMGISPKWAGTLFNPKTLDTNLQGLSEYYKTDTFMISEDSFDQWHNSLIGAEGRELLKQRYENEINNALSDLNLQYTDYITGLFDYQGNLTYNQSDNKEAFYNEAKRRFDEIEKTKETISTQMLNLDKNSQEYQVLESYYKYLSSISSTLDPLVNHEDISAGMQAMADYQDKENRTNIINNQIMDMIGKNESTPGYTFGAFVESAESIYNSITETQTQWSTLTKYFKDGQVIEGKGEQLDQAKRELAQSFIKDYTSLEDFLSIYQTLLARFSQEGGENSPFEQAKAYISGKKITDSRVIDTRFLNALEKDIQSGDQEDRAGAVLEYNTSKVNLQKKIASYDSMTGIVSSYKENLDLSDAQSLQTMLQTVLEDGNTAWEEFILLDYDERKAYLEAREQSALDAIRINQESIIKTAQAEQEKLFKTQADFENAQTLYNSYKYDNTTQTYTDINGKDVTKEAQTLAQNISDYQQYDLDIDSAEAVINAIKLMTTQSEGLVTQISTLASEFEKFNKTGRISAEVIKQMAKWGIDASNIKNAQDYLKVMKSIYTQAKNKADTAEQNYLAMVGDNKYDWSDEQVQKDHDKEFIAWQEMMRLKQIEYDTEEQYNTTKQSHLDSELAKHQQILSQMRERKSLAEEEANKTQQLAEAMSAAIQTGNLSESARVGMDPELLNAWDSAANATERGAIAAQAWNKYATQISTAGEELSALYDTASTSLDHIIAAGKRQGKADILNFNFADATNGKNDFIDYIASRVKDPAAQAVWNEGFESLISHTDISNMSDLDILTAVKDEIIKAGNITEEEFNRILAGVRDNIASTFEQLAQQNIDAAQKAADAWLTAFNTIKNARQTLLSGGNILDQIAGDPDAIFDLMQSTGKGAQELYDMILKNDKEGLLTATSDYMNSGDYLKNLMGSKGYVTSDFGQKNRLRDIHSLGYSVKNGKWVDSTGAETDVAKIQENLAQHYAKLLQSTEKLDPESALAKARQLATGEIDYADLSQEAKMFADALGISTEALKEQAKQQELAADVEYKGNASNLTKEQIEAEGALVNGQVGTYDEYQKLATAIANAQEAKYNGETWDSLAQEDRDLLDKYNIDFNNVDTAAADCASALAACANAAYQLALAAAKEQGYDYDSSTGTYTKDGNEVTAKNDPIVQELEASRTGAERATANISDVSSNTYAQMAKSVGMTTEQLESYCERMIEAGKITETTKDAQMDVARSLARTSRGFDKVEKSLDDYMTTLQKTNKTSAKYEDTLDDLRDMYGDVLDLSADLEKDLPDAFLESEENARLLKIAMEDAGEAGDKAYDQLQTNAAKSILLAKNVEISPEFENALYTMASQVDQFEVGKPITLGEVTQISPNFGAALNTLVSQAAMAGDQAASIIQSAAEAMGFDAEVETKTFPVTGSAIEYQQGATIFDPASNTTYVSVTPNVTQDTGEVTAVALKTITPKGVSGGGIRSGSGGGGGSSGGGGGGSKKKEKKEHKRYRDEIERYHKNNEVLSRISETLDKVDKLKNRAYGNKHIDQLNAETDALKEQLEAQQALHDETKKYQAADQIAIARYGAQFDADGTIVNYEQVMRNIVDEYNRAVDVYNNSAQEDGDKERLEAAEQRFEDAKKSIEDYEEAIAKANESMNDMLETQNKISEIETEKITYKLALQIEMNERDLERFEYYQEKYEDSLKDQGIVYKSIYDSMLEYENNLAVISEAMAALDQKRKDGLITDADYTETLQDLYDQIFENLGDLTEIQNELVDTYTNTLELARKEVEKTTDSIESANSALQSYLDIIALSGGKTDYEKMAYFYEKMNENNLIKINIQRDHLNALLEEEDKFQEKIKSGQQLTDLEQKQYEALREEIQDTRDTLLSSTTEALEAIRTTYENTISSIAKDFEEFMVGAGNSIEHLQEQYGYFQEEQDNYVSTAKELYEVSKLNRDIEGALGDATSKAAKEALKALQEKINKQSELNQLTEYDIEMNQLQYELLMARIKLEESQNAKDVVRLTRDENGNYAYRYTANQDKIDEAAQKYEDILQQINDTTAQQTADIESRMLETMAWAKEQMSAIAMDYTLTEEEKRDRLEELNNQFAAKMQYLHEQNGIATENLITNQEAIAEHYGVNLSEITSSTAGNVNTQIQSMIEKTQEYITKMNEALFGEGGADQSWKDYLEDIGIITSNAGTAYGDMIENTQEMGEMNNWSAEQAQEVIETLTDTLEPLETLTAAWDAHNSILEATISDYENLAQVIQGVLSAVGEIPNGGSATDVDGHAYAKGGMVDYTGLAWVDGSPSDPEMMLNPGDTQNILKATAMVKSLDSGFIGALVDSVKSAAQAMMHMFSGAAHAVTNIHPAATESLEQSVHITAEFPNVQDHNEIEEALLGLVNRSAQFANQKK